MSVTPDSPDWAPHVALADQISATGVPLLRATNNLGTAVSTTVAGGQQVTLVGPVAVTQPGYEICVQVSIPAGTGTLPFIRMTVTWTDSVSGLTLGFRNYYMTSGNGPGNVLTYYVTGPCHGDQVQVFVTNIDPAATATLQWTVNQTSHLYQHDQLIQPGYAATAPQGFTNPAGDPSTGVLMVATPTIAAATTTSRLLAARSGKALLCVDNFTGTNAMWCKLTDPDSLYSSQGAVSAPVLSLAAGAVANTEVTLPYGPMLLQMRNQGASGSISPGIVITALDY